LRQLVRFKIDAASQHALHISHDFVIRRLEAFIGRHVFTIPVKLGRRLHRFAVGISLKGTLRALAAQQKVGQRQIVIFSDWLIAEFDFVTCRLWLRHDEYLPHKKATANPSDQKTAGLKHQPYDTVSQQNLPLGFPLSYGNSY
jgi:hypothetical protein